MPQLGRQAPSETAIMNALARHRPVSLFDGFKGALELLEAAFLSKLCSSLLRLVIYTLFVCGRLKNLGLVFDFPPSFHQMLAAYDPSTAGRLGNAFSWKGGMHYILMIIAVSVCVSGN